MMAAEQLECCLCSHEREERCWPQLAFLLLFSPGYWSMDSAVHIQGVCVGGAGVLSHLVKPLWGYPHHYTHVYSVCFLGGSTSYQADSEDNPP